MRMEPMPLMETSGVLVKTCIFEVPLAMHVIVCASWNRAATKVTLLVDIVYLLSCRYGGYQLQLVCG